MAEGCPGLGRVVVGSLGRIDHSLTTVWRTLLRHADGEAGHEWRGHGAHARLWPLGEEGDGQRPAQELLRPDPGGGQQEVAGLAEGADRRYGRRRGAHHSGRARGEVHWQGAAEAHSRTLDLGLAAAWRSHGYRRQLLAAAE